MGNRPICSEQSALSLSLPRQDGCKTRKDTKYCITKSEYDQGIPQSHTADQSTAPRGEEEPQNIYSNNTSER